MTTRVLIEQKFRTLLPWAFYAVAGLFSVYVMLVFMISQGLGVQWDNIREIMDDNARRPLNYRMLVPSITRFIVMLTPGALEQWMTAWLLDLRGSGVFTRYVGIRYANMPASLDAPWIYGLFVLYAVAYGFLIGFLVQLKRLGVQLFPDSPAVALVAPLLALLALGAMQRQYALNYDYAVLFFFTASLYALSREKWREYLILFALATANKETSIYLTAFFALYYWQRMPRKHYVHLLLMQGAIYLLVKGGVSLYYGGGEGLVFGVAKHASNLLKGYNYTILISLLMTVFLLSWRWQEKPEFLRWALILCPISVLGYWTVGVVGEYRQMLEMLPVCALLAAHTLMEGSGIGRMPVFRAMKR